MLQLKKELQGSILDIGGGGEGIIGRLYKEQVIAIDNCQEELDEAPNGFEKVFMDATGLTFQNETFDHTTFFYTLMFMDTEDQRQAVNEAVRVLKPGGKLHIWDCEIKSAYPDPFCINVAIQLPDEQLTTTYGIGKLSVQSRISILQMCTDAGLILLAEETSEYGFYLHFQKKY